MGGVTPNGMPYPVGTDLVVDGDNAIRALAEAVDPFVGDTGWISLGVSELSTSGDVVYRVIGKFVTVGINVTGAYGAGDIGLSDAGVPPEFRPPAETDISPSVSYLNPSGVGVAYVNLTSGSVRHTRGVAGTTSIRAVVQYVI